MPTSTAGSPGAKGGVRQGHRRLHRGHPARPQARLRLQQSRHALAQAAGVRQGHRRLHRGHPARSQTPSPTIIAAPPGRKNKDHDEAIADFDEAIRLDPKTAEAIYVPWWPQVRQGGIRQGHRRLHRGHPARPEDAVDYVYRGWAWYEEELRQGHRRLQRGHPARSQTPGPTRPAPGSGRPAPTPSTATARGRRIGHEQCELTEWKDPASIDTLAAAYAEAGDFDAAVKWQTKANALFSDAETRTKGEARLKLYQEKKPYRDEEP